MIEIEKPILMTINIGFSNEKFSFVLPIKLKMNNKNRFCNLSFNYVFDKGYITFFSSKATKEGYISVKYWANYTNEMAVKDVVSLKKIEKLDDKHNYLLVFDDIVTPQATTLSKVCTVRYL